MRNLPARLCPCLVALAFVAVSARASPTLDAGWAHNMAVTPSGQAWGWGQNLSYQLGNGASTNSAVPVRAGSLDAVVAVAAGAAFSAALRSDGTVWRWGSGDAANSTVPERVPGIAGATAIAAGASHLLILMGDGTVRALGNNEFGQLGNGTVTDSPSPVTVAGLAGVQRIAAGAEISVALRTDGTVWAWGTSTHGELGTGTTGPSTCPGDDAYRFTQVTQCARTPVRVPGLAGIADISTRGRHTLAIDDAGRLWAWGSNHYGQVGDGTMLDRTAPFPVPGMTGVVQAAAGFSHSMARRSDGTVWVWGLNNSGQLGVASSDTCASDFSVVVPSCTLSPFHAAAFRGAAALAGGGAHSLVVRTDETIEAFGYNASGQLGHGPADFVTFLSTIDPHTPLLIGSPGSATSIGKPSTSGGLNTAKLDDGVSFPDQPVGVRSAAVELQFTNLSYDPIGIVSVRTYGNFAVAHDCGATLQGGGECRLRVTFTPTLPGERQGSLVIVTDTSTAPRISLQLTGAGASAVIPVNYSDIWWNPAESGWGLTVSDHETNLFAVWYTYEASGRPTWFVIPGGTFSANRRFFTGTVYTTTGPCYRAATFDTALVDADPVGTATLDFAPADLPAGWARFSGTIGSTGWSRAITRQPFGNASPAWGSDYTDIWWNPAESGWGFALAQHGDNVFGVLFTYECDGKPLFVALPSVGFSGDAAFAGTFYTTRSAGSWWGSAVFDPADVTPTPVGSATVAFSGRTASFNATINGSTRVRTIEQQPFGNRAPGTP